jgi:hypothetical protein
MTYLKVIDPAKQQLAEFLSNTRPNPTGRVIVLLMIALDLVQLGSRNGSVVDNVSIGLTIYRL